MPPFAARNRSRFNIVSARKINPTIKINEIELLLLRFNLKSTLTAALGVWVLTAGASLYFLFDQSKGSQSNASQVPPTTKDKSFFFKLASSIEAVEVEVSFNISGRSCGGGGRSQPPSSLGGNTQSQKKA